MPTTVSREDQRFVEALRADGVLQAVETFPALEQFRDGVDLVFCGDCDLSWDKEEHIGAVLTRRIHRHALNGGAIVLDPSFPANAGMPVNILFRQDILDALHMKRLRAVVLMAHWPCSKARVFGQGVREVLCSLVNGKDYLRLQANDVTVLCAFHFSHADERLRTYAVDEARLRERLGVPAMADRLGSGRLGDRA